ncbi:MAG: hypothetical protein ACREGC_04335 [Minisyncoccia bacterium]
MINEKYQMTPILLRDLKNGAQQQILDDETINRGLKAYGAQLDGHWLFEKQLELWSNDTLSSSQRRQIERAQEQLPQIKANFEVIVELLNTLKIKDQTIDKMLGMDDAEVGLRALLEGLYGSSEK